MNGEIGGGFGNQACSFCKTSHKVLAVCPQGELVVIPRFKYLLTSIPLYEGTKS